MRKANWPGRQVRIPRGDLDILAIGETVVDLISVEESDSLRAPYTFRKYLGGAPANVAASVAKLGGKAAVIAKIGSDPFGHFLKEELTRYGVCTDYLVMDPSVQTSVVFVSRTESTPDFEAFRDGDFQLTPDEIPEEAIARAKVVQTSTWPLSREPSRSAVVKALRLASEQRKVVSLDPNYSPAIWPNPNEAKRFLAEIYHFVEFTKPSLDDAQRLFGELSPEEYVRAFQRLGPRLVVLTLGERGCLICEGESITRVPAFEVKATCSTGVGDAFWAGFLLSWLEGQPAIEAARFASAVAALKVITVGTTSPLPPKDQIYQRLAEVMDKCRS